MTITKSSTKMKEKSPSKDALIIGGGVSGMQAALDIANQGFHVYLVEKSPSIGGRMAQIDKTFPTLDCSACILTPKLSEVGRHPDIELFTYSEVKEVTGEEGNFTVEVLKKARMVEEELCSGCGQCIEVCPIEVPNEFDQNLGFRKAVYMPFPQATPSVVTVDMENCIECSRCVTACEREAINHSQRDETITLNVGAIIIATGYNLFDVSEYSRFGYSKFPNVIHAMEYERLINAAGPTAGHMIRLSDGKIPQSIAFIQCVGARDVNKGVPLCSRICCMYGIKNAVMAKEHEPDTDVTVYYLDIRAFGKDFEQFYERAKTRFGVKFIRGRVGEVVEDPESNNLIVTVEDTETGEVLQVEHDLVVLSPGIQPPPELAELVEKIGLDVDENGYVEARDTLSTPVDTTISGVYVCGCAEGPKDIPDSVSEGSAAAMRATISLNDGGD
ncbi:CoB--CoM heterodisulfide reductase iron-sulfur subunit A family protein [Candidatus Thorarchaeota archaeon]|nr:MAG: CoB--CoM heterodisulfide reductase iron-sulfur subunit A family protein [Candidatus Thorarchaeota archaeon]